MATAEPAIDYHERTKHHFARFASSLGYLDWANQPAPFRRFAGVELRALPFAADDSPPYDAIYGPVPPSAGDLAFIAELFFRSLALSAWKELGGARWSLRCNPSSGNLHPTEGYLVCGPVAGLAPHAGVWHYAPDVHGLELRCRLPADRFAALTAGLPAGTILVGLSSISWREAWKYGERAYRYCQHDAGHALAAVSLAAASLGWRAQWLDGLGDDEVASCLGLDRAADFPLPEEESEHPEALVAVFPPAAACARDLPGGAVAGFAAGEWTGYANRLSTEHVRWDLLHEVAASCRKPATAGGVRPVVASAGAAAPPRAPSARRIFRQRRSAVAMDGTTTIDATTFAGMLARALPQPGMPPYDLLPDEPAIHLALFVHRVQGLGPGLYLLPRRADDVPALRAAMRPEFLWEAPAGWPSSVPLRLLVPADVRATARRLSCDQTIASDGVFSLGMIAEFEPRLQARGAWCYRRLHWEAGMIGQVLYLEAEAAGLRATGIGCFYDDPMHGLLGLEDRRWQSIYHFTVGGPVEDPRLLTLPAYPDRER